MANYEPLRNCKGYKSDNINRGCTRLTELFCATENKRCKFYDPNDGIDDYIPTKDKIENFFTKEK